MTLSRRRKSVSLIILMMAVYATVFLLHDLTYCRLTPLAGSLNGDQDVLTAQHGEGVHSDSTLFLTAPGTHHCPFCNGFTGSVTVAQLSPPAIHHGQASNPHILWGHGAPWSSPIARAPPAA